MRSPVLVQRAWRGLWAEHGRRVTRQLVLGALVAVCLGAAGCGSSPAPSGVRVRAASWRLPGGAHAVLRPPTHHRPARALIFLIHGGGWAGLSRRQFAGMEAAARAYAHVGYATVVADYRAGAAGVRDLDRIYARTRRAVGRRLPICTFGGSSGGHLALMLALHHPDLSCAVSLAGPTDLVALVGDPVKPQYAEVAARFGTDRLARYSPARRARRIHAALLLVYADNDPFVPASQGELMKRAKPASRLILLRPGHSPFIHSEVDGVQLARARRTVAAFLARHALPAR